MVKLGGFRHVAGLAFVVAASVALAACDIGEITDVTEAGWRAEADAPEGWSEVIANPTDIKVTAYVTGEVFAGGGVLIDPGVDGVPEGLGEDRWVPSLSYLVQHPSGKNVLLDSGVRAGECGYQILVVLDFPCRNKPGQDVVSQLSRDGIGTIDYLVATHFHGDHASGLGPVIERYDPVVLASSNEIEALKSPLRETQGYRYEQFAADMRVEAADNGFLEMPYIGKAADLFADGSVWLLATPGHTPGHMSVFLNASSGPILMTFDAAHLEATYRYNAPGGLGADLEVASDSISKLTALADAMPGVALVFGHEPTQWAGEAIRRDLTTIE
ncbi:MBL fold metallo-hydrolase [Pyruvatibacter sp.]|nr:MBL fold metallo-hydrolase [Alphaproteobacteria bacterium]